VLIVVGGGVLLGVGFAIVYATVIEPNARMNKAQKEIASWSDAWTEARACLVGTEARSTDPMEAYVARELLDLDTVANLRACLEPLKDLRRKPGASTGEQSVELAWSDLNKAIGKLGTAYALRAAEEKQAPESRLRVRLAAGISAVDDAYATLRATSEMPAPQIPGGGALPQAEPAVTIAERVTGFHIRGNSIVATGALTGEPPGEYAARIDRPDPAREEFRPREPLAVTSDRGPLWGVWLDPGDGQKTGDALSAGPLDDRGAPEGAGIQVVSTAPGGAVSAMYATGDAQSRLIVYRVQRADFSAQIRIAASQDGGATWKQTHALSADAHLVRSESLARADITWIEDGRVKWLPIAGGAIERQSAIDLAPEILLGYSGAMRPCFGEAAAWWILPSAIVHVTADGKASPVPGIAQTSGMVLCDDKHLVEVHAEQDTELSRALRITRCRPTACDMSMELPLANDAMALAALGPKRGTSVMVATNGVVAVWSGQTASAEPLALTGVYSLPPGHDPYGLVEWNGRLHTISEQAGKLVSSRLPE
jgi:hypothetical protein